MRIKVGYYGRIKKESGIFMKILKSIVTLKGGGELELNETEIKFTRDEPKRIVFL